MPLEAPDDRTLALSTARLRLEPITVEHAEELHQLLADPELHRFVPSDPPTLPELRERYRGWMARISPASDELWLNWAARRIADGALIGHFQAGLDEQGDASIAYTVGTAHQRRGYALESLRAICSFLTVQLGAKRVRAWIDTRNEASLALVRRLGLRESERITAADHFKGAPSDEFVYELPPGWTA